MDCSVIITSHNDDYDLLLQSMESVHMQNGVEMDIYLSMVDDDPNITAAIARSLEPEPFEILCADSAKEGLDILSRTDIDVVVSDDQMPVMSGSVFLAKVRQKYPHTIRMILTGQASIESAIRAINEGQVYRFFTKPCNPADLAITIRTACIEDNRLSVQAGAGIVADSDPETEYSETRNKAMALEKALALVSDLQYSGEKK